MYFALYGMRILGIFPNQVDAITYIIDVKDKGYYKHEEALDVKYLGITKMETLSDLEELK
jgi:hypothetical protein